jgi:RimJ/RimL family protein N-acetyltransferase
MILETPRLRLEPFAPHHLDGLCVLNGDPQVMRYITGQPQTEAETLQAIERVAAEWATRGYSWWAFLDKQSDALVGAGCVQHIERNPLNPLELGWRLVPSQWGKGLASEAARRMAAFAFNDLDATLLLAIAMPDNRASRRVMERLGMQFRGIEHWWQKEVATYALDRAEWKASAAYSERT